MGYGIYILFIDKSCEEVYTYRVEMWSRQLPTFRLYSLWHREAHEVTMEGNRFAYVFNLDPSRHQLQRVRLVDVTKDE